MHCNTSHRNPGNRNDFLDNIQMMSMKGRFVTTLFVALFSVYAISPLSCALTENRLCHTTTSFAGSVRLFFWELLCSRFATEDNSSQTSAGRILARKARAVLSSNPNLRTMPSMDSSAHESAVQHDLFCENGILCITQTKEPLKADLVRYPGLSPPSA